MKGCPDCAAREAEDRETQAVYRLSHLRKVAGLRPHTGAVLLALYDTRQPFLSRQRILNAVGKSYCTLNNVSVAVVRARKVLGQDAVENLRGDGFRLTPAGRERVRQLLGEPAP